MEGILNEVRTFVKTSLMVPPDIQDDTSLMASGVIDSMGIIEIVSFIEDKFSIVVSDEEVAAENFDSIEKIASFVEARKA